MRTEDSKRKEGLEHYFVIFDKFIKYDEIIR